MLNHARLGESVALHAVRLVIDHSIYCADFVAEGGIYLVGARIGGDVIAVGGAVPNGERQAGVQECWARRVA